MSKRSTQGKRPGLWAVVPVKPFDRTKGRLAPLLSRPEREALACAMLRDVLTALTQARELAGVVVVTGDAKAAKMARAAGALVVRDAENAGTTAAVMKAAEHLTDAGCEGMLVIPADLPLIRAIDIKTIIAAHRASPSVTLVPASVDGGTNALACSPPGAIRFSFGDDSFRQHRDSAKALGIEPQVLKIARIEQDIDRPDDLAEFVQHPSSTHSYDCLTASGIAQRLWAAAGSV